MYKIASENQQRRVDRIADRQLIAAGLPENFTNDEKWQFIQNALKRVRVALVAEKEVNPSGHRYLELCRHLKFLNDEIVYMRAAHPKAMRPHRSAEQHFRDVAKELLPPETFTEISVAARARARRTERQSASASLKNSVRRLSL